MNSKQRCVIAILLAFVAHLFFFWLFPLRFAVNGQPVSRRVVAMRLIALKPVPLHRHRVLRRRRARLHLVMRSRRMVRGRARGKPHHLYTVQAAAPRKAQRRHELAHKPLVPITTAHALSPINGAGRAGLDTSGDPVGGGAGGQAHSGQGAIGLGRDAQNGDIPCGAVDLVSVATKEMQLPASTPNGPSPQTQIQHTIQATAHFADGTVQTARFPYPFVYGPNEDDPFAHRNRDNDHMLILVQLPPSGFDRAELSQIIRAILARTSSEGLSLLLPCLETPAP